MKSRAEFLSLAEESQFYILKFLPYRDILRCTLVCRSLRQVYISYSELQYIVELGGQQLLHVPDTDPSNRTSISQRLKLLRDRPHAWLKFGVQPCAKISIPEQFHDGDQSGWVANGHLCLWNSKQGLVMVSPILPKASQQTIKRDPSTRPLYSNPNAHIFDVFMDPAQNLIAIAYVITDDHLESGNAMFCIEIEALDGSGIHPRAAGQTLSLFELPGYEQPAEVGSNHLKLKGLGRHIAFKCWRSPQNDGPWYEYTSDLWVLQIWDWQRSTTSSCVLIVDDADPAYDGATDFCFLGNDRLLIFDEKLKLYSIENMSQAPQFLACFLVPITTFTIGCTECALPMDGSTQPQMQTEQTMWTSDPKNQLLKLRFDIFRPPSLDRSIPFDSIFIFIISTRIFFNTGFSGDMKVGIPWKEWGPSNSRAFRMNSSCVGVSGNRVLLASSANVYGAEHELQVMDFSPLAVERRKGLGRVVKGPSTLEISKPKSGEEATFTTNLPYVKVVLNKTFGGVPICRIWIEQDRIYICGKYRHRFKLEVIEITSRAAEAAEITQADLEAINQSL
ncbi:hypothetical protein DEU56DRAFT_204464 [Suillus clintonianus]|uniref:uncharacterized protein n=1 Tax=Suillus clintonianus TaxID=1904413 RepID=UPI001B85EDE1|nr:uncharacterized protein DEU56DRAFT_204464 [Suillus clintonianus]KAG2111827.1 hypothetical protein DEU56DRAFT_204464 [Suillus clintonianus]